MSVLDVFLNAMKMNDDDGAQDDYLDDGYDDYEEEERPKKRILKKNREEEEERPASAAKAEPAENEEERPQTTARPRVRPARANSKISPMRSPRRGTGMEVCVIRPRSMEDACEITQALLDECTVILNMEGVDYELAQRIIDFSGGSSYALDGNLQKISNYIFIITPQSVDISGDFQEILNGAFDVPSFGTKF